MNFERLSRLEGPSYHALCLHKSPVINAAGRTLTSIWPVPLTVIKLWRADSYWVVYLWHFQRSPHNKIRGASGRVHFNI